MKVINRLKKSSDFKNTFHQSSYKRTNAFKIYLKSNALGHLRVGISTGKVLGNAVTRARIRRQIRAFFSVYNIYGKNYDIVIVVQPGFLRQPGPENQQELLGAINALMDKGEQR